MVNAWFGFLYLSLILLMVITLFYCDWIVGRLGDGKLKGASRGATQRSIVSLPLPL